MISRSPLPSTALETRLSVWRKNTGETFSSTAVTFTVACSWWALHLPCSRETLFCTVAPLSGMEPLGVEWVLCAQEHLFAHHVSLQFLLLVKGGNACGERDDSNYHSLSDDFTSQEKKYKPYDVHTILEYVISMVFGCISHISLWLLISQTLFISLLRSVCERKHLLLETSGSQFSLSRGSYVRILHPQIQLRINFFFLILGSSKKQNYSFLLASSYLHRFTLYQV